MTLVTKMAIRKAQQHQYVNQGSSTILDSSFDGMFICCRQAFKASKWWTFIILLMILLFHDSLFLLKKEYYDELVVVRDIEAKTTTSTSSSTTSTTTSAVDIQEHDATITSDVIVAVAPVVPSQCQREVVVPSVTSVELISWYNKFNESNYETQNWGNAKRYVRKYREKVVNSFTNRNRNCQQSSQSSQKSSSSTTTPKKRTICLDHVFQCLQLTPPSNNDLNLNLTYPVDAEYHFNEIRLKLAEYAQHTHHKYHNAAGYDGPWIENHFITYFESFYDEKLHDDQCLSDIYGPYIPIFIPFVDYWVHNRGYSNEFVTLLKSVLRPTVPYIAVSQNDDGLPGRHPNMEKFMTEEFPNVLVLSGGGYGHVPIPLVKQTEDLRSTNNIPIQNRTYFTSYVGSLTHAPNQMRQRLHKRLMDVDKTMTATSSSSSSPENMMLTSISSHMTTTSMSQTGDANSTTKNSAAASELHFYKYYYGNDWRDTMDNSKYSLCPRGFGRTSYHVMETLQMGYIPIQIYSDIPWLPYHELFQEKGIGYSISTNEASFYLRTLLSKTTNEELQRKEDLIRQLRDSHFTIDGIMNQISKFMLGDPSSDLRCVPLPNSVRDG